MEVVTGILYLYGLLGTVNCLILAKLHAHSLLYLCVSLGIFAGNMLIHVLVFDMLFIMIIQNVYHFRATPLSSLSTLMS